MKNENENIGIKEMIESLVEPEPKQLSQEDAIRKYTTPKNSKLSSGTDDEDDNSEEEAHLKRIREELLKSLERVKEFETKLYGGLRRDSLKKLNVKERNQNTINNKSQQVEGNIKEDDERMR